MLWGMSFRGYRTLLRLRSYLVEAEINVSSSSKCNQITWLKYKRMSKRKGPKKGRTYKSVLTSEVIFSNRCKKRRRIEQIWPTYSLGFLWQNKCFGFGFFMLLTAVITALQSWTKSEGLCYLVVITTGNNSWCFSPIFFF